MERMALDRRSLHVLVEAVPTEPDGFYWRGLGWVGAEKVIEATGPSREGVASACLDAVELALTATEASSGTCDARVVRYDDYERCDRPGNPCDRHRVEEKGDEAK